MRGNIVKSVVKKEIIDILRDKKTLFMTVMLPIVLYPIIFLIIALIISCTSKSMAQKELNIAFGFEPGAAIIKEIENRTEEEGELNIVATEDYNKELKEGKLDAYIESRQEGESIHYEIYIDSSNEDSNEACDRLEEIFNKCKRQETDNRLNKSGIDKEYILEPITYSSTDVAEKEQVMGYLLGEILPLVLIMGILIGAIYPAIDCMAGEKERGTLETLLTLPISNLELVVGKYLSVSLCALVSALLNVISIVFGIGLLMLSMDAMEELKGFDLAKLALPLFITLISMGLFALIISAVSMCLCSLTKSFKEAQNTITPLMLVAMLLSYSSMIPTLKLDKVTSMIPVVNVALLIKSVLTFNYDMGLIMIVLVSNVAFVIITIWLLARMFNSEEILFGTGKGFSFLEKRSNIKKGTLPTLSDGFITYAFVMLIFLYVCSFLQLRFKLFGVALTELIIASIPILLSIYIKTDMKKVYSIKAPSVMDLVGALMMWIGTYFITILISNIQAIWFPQDMEKLTRAQYELMGEHGLIVSLFVIAILPAICEETLFRGFLLNAFVEEKHPVRGILLCGVTFGIMHVSLFKLIPITILGIMIAYVVYKTKSIFAGILIHFLNNGLAVLASSRLAQNIDQVQISKFAESLSIVSVAICLVISAVMLFLGNKMINYKN